MKYRKDFVTNSSSSSYVCDICGRQESGYDMGLSEADMMECVNGHTFCVDEALEIPDKNGLVQLILENEWNKNAWDSELRKSRNFSKEELEEMEEDDLFDKFCSEGGYYEVPECVCPICQFHEYSQSDMVSFLLKEYGIPKDEVFEEVKKANRRRRKLYDGEYITYVCQKLSLNPIEIQASWKKQFKTYAAFKEYIGD